MNIFDMNIKEVLEIIENSKYKPIISDMSLLYHTPSGKKFFITIYDHGDKFIFKSPNHTDIKRIEVAIKRRTISKKNILLAFNKTIKWFEKNEEFFEKKQKHEIKLNKIINNYIKREYPDSNEIYISISIEKKYNFYSTKKTPTEIPIDIRNFDFSNIKYNIISTFNIENAKIRLEFSYENKELKLDRKFKYYNNHIDISNIIRAERLKKLLNLK